MRKRSITFYLHREVIPAFAMEVYRMSPNGKPFRAEEIIETVRSKLKEKSYNFGMDEADTLVFTANENTTDFYVVLRELKSILFDIPEFHILNFSSYEMHKVCTEEELKGDIHDLAVKLCDSRDGKENTYVFTSAYTGIKEEHNFIDVDALLQNFVYHLFRFREMGDRECMFCVRDQKHTKICDICIRNDKLEDHLQINRYPRGDRKTVCNEDCPNGFYICCEECKKESCDFRCTDSIETCQNWYYKDGKKKGKK